MDFSFLAAQTFGDRDLQRDLLELFLSHTCGQLPRLPTLSATEQSDLAHRLKGSCQGIGAWPAAEAAQMFEDEVFGDTAADGRSESLARLTQAFAETELAIRAHLASL